MRVLHSAYVLASVTALTLCACTPAPRPDTVNRPSAPEAASLPSGSQVGTATANNARSVGEGHEESPAHSDGATAGLRLAEARCSGCHAVTPGQVSPNSDAPPFASIVQRPGLTHSTATSWLRESHDFPEQMNFYLDHDQAEQLAAYLLTLREAN